MAPRADQDSYRTICDWGNWIFPFDDLFDDGDLRKDHIRARTTIDSLLCVFDNETLVQIDEGEPLVRFHDGIWARVKAAGSPGVQRRYAQAMRDYCAGALEQVEQFEVHAAPEVEAMLAMRRKSVCVSTLFALVEFGHQIALPDSVFANPVMAQIETIGIDITLMHNDLLSYRKEESEGVPHNLVAVARMHGMSAQEAFDHIGGLITVRHQRLETTIAQLPSWGAVVDREVLRYVQAIKDVVKANLYWTFKSGRFFSEAQKAQATTTGRLDVLAEPSYLTRKDLLARETLAQLRHQYDELGSRALDKLLKESEQMLPTQGCPLPKKDLFATLKACHDSDAEMRQFWNETMSVPSWVDWEQIERGQRFFYRYAVANIIGFALQGFIGENAAAFGPAEVLIRTGGLSAKNLLQRVMETFQWLLEATESLASIKPGGKGHTSTIRVRLLHASVRRRILQLAETRSSYFNIEDFGIPVNTYDSILTVSFFCCNPLWIQLPHFGIHPSQTELEDFVALYRYLSYLLGVPDVYLSSAEQAKATMDAMLADKKPPSDSSRKICHAFVDCLADREPFRISRSFVEAGSRSMNPEKLCDGLRLGRLDVIYYVAFTGLCWTLRLLALVQALSQHFDNKMISVSISEDDTISQGTMLTLPCSISRRCCLPLS